MTFFKMAEGGFQWGRGACLGATVLALAACGGSDHLPPPPPAAEVDATGQPIIQAGDIAIAGQLFAHSIMNLPEVGDAAVPPLVRFTGVVNAVSGPVDTAPYTSLLRDRLLLITREKLRFVEHVLPPLTSHRRKHAEVAGSPPADFEVLAQLRGNLSDDTYLIRIQFLDLHSDQALFDGLYRIHKELPETSGTSTVTNGQEVPQVPAPAPNSSDIESTAPNPPVNYEPGPAPAPTPDPNTPMPPPSDSSGFQ